MTANEFEHNRENAMGMFKFIRYMGMAVGPIVSGLLLTYFQPTVVFGILLLLNFGMLLQLKKEHIKIV
ncbi:hypothetical protein [Bacillus sp. FDAARGOS_1420]|uniref:hypothetical protein n=1 Tax=unclassified Bacillus (in: firmicutes) TaxID=185979 RepID=UPI00214B9C13